MYASLVAPIQWDCYVSRIVIGGVFANTPTIPVPPLTASLSRSSKGFPRHYSARRKHHRQDETEKASWTPHKRRRHRHHFDPLQL